MYARNESKFDGICSGTAPRNCINQENNSPLGIISIIFSPNKYNRGVISICGNELKSTGAVYTDHQIISRIELEKLIREDSKVFSTKKQISLLRKVIGLTISEIAKIMNISRQTVYDWMETDVPKLRLEHQKKLDDVCEICAYWGGKNLGRLGSYLHKKISNEDTSLISLLMDKEINQDKIRHLLDQIERSILNEKNRKKLHDELLKSHGFGEITQEELDRNFNNIVQKIG